MTRTFSEFEDFKGYLLERAGINALVVEPCPLSECKGWEVSSDHVGRPDGKFFQLVGRRVRAANGREESFWFQPMIVEVDTGYVGLVFAKSEGKLLVRVKGEPGNKGVEIDGQDTHVLVSPPLQFSRSNLNLNDRVLRGEITDRAPIPLAHLHNDARFPHQSADAKEDGGRFAGKVNTYDLIIVPNLEVLEADIQADKQRDDFAWVSLQLFAELGRQGLLNGHLRSVASTLVE